MSARLTSCSACGSKISSAARACPRCGKPRTTSSGVITAIAFGLVAGLIVLWLLVR